MPTRKKSNVYKSTGNVDSNRSTECCAGSLECLQKAKDSLKEQFFKINSNFFVPGILSQQEQQLKSVIEQCVKAGESNSLLVIGPRGTGKSKLVSKVLLDVCNNFSGDYFYVYLNGLIHTDDRNALQDIARQLHLENVIGDRVFGSFSDNLAFILDALKNDSGQSKSVILVLDEFELFTFHKNQSLLYNLFDIAQSKQNPICVIGLTCRVNVVELLEKRVKSRYSHRTIFTFPKYSFDEYLKITRALLTIPDECSCCVFRKNWQESIENLLGEAESVDVLERHYDYQRDFRNLIKLLTPALYSLSPEKPFISSNDLVDAYLVNHMDSKTALLNGLSTLELSLLVAAMHVFNRREGQPFNYEMIYNEYENFLKRRLSGMQNYNKAVAYKAYEHLLSLELLTSTESFSHNNSCKEFKPMTLLIEPSQIKEIVHKFAECPTELRQWADSMFAG